MLGCNYFTLGVKLSGIVLLEVIFRTNKLQRQFERKAEAEKAFGKDVARKFIQRVNIIKSSGGIGELRKLPGLRCHELKGNRKGQWAINLTGFFRLIFSLEGEKLHIACVEEVSKHYDQ